MAFSQAGITDVRVALNGADLFISWSSTLPASAKYQVYVDRRLVWYGSARRCHVPVPSGSYGRNIWVEVGTVGAFEPTRDYSSSLTAPGGRSGQASLSWQGGTYLDPTGADDLYGFRIYRGAGPGQPVDMSTPVATVVAYPGGWINDGFGKGRFGCGGFGRAATRYSWQSGPLGPGTWQFVVQPIDRAANGLAAPHAVSVAISSSPRPPAKVPGSARLTSNYSGPTDRRLTIQWQPSPSDTR